MTHLTNVITVKKTLEGGGKVIAESRNLCCFSGFKGLHICLPSDFTGGHWMVFGMICSITENKLYITDYISRYRTEAGARN